MNLAAIGINFRTAPVELRERLAFPVAGVPRELSRLRDELPETELMLLSTCNRTELYAAAREIDVDALIAALLGDDDGDMAGLGKLFYVMRGQDAAEHLMSVAVSLDSLVVGETEILGQVKQAYRLAADEGTAGRVLNTVLQQVFRVAKRVRTETEISRGRVSVGSIAVDLAQKVFDDIATKTVMVIGAGEMGEQTVGSLVDRGVTEILVANRSQERGQAVADRYDGRAVRLDRLADFLPRADMVISSTSAPGYVLSADVVREAARARRDRPMLLIDLAVPRDIEEAVGHSGNVYLYDIDDLQGISKVNLMKRKEAVTVARQIVAEEASRVMAAFRTQTIGVGSLMMKLDQRMAEIREGEMNRAFSKEKVAPLGDECQGCRDEICAMLHRALSKMAADPKKALHQAAKSDDWAEFANVAASLFGFECEQRDEAGQNRDAQ